MSNSKRILGSTSLLTEEEAFSKSINTKVLPIVIPVLFSSIWLMYLFVTLIHSASARRDVANTAGNWCTLCQLSSRRLSFVRSL